jgi:hypothetical protein
MNSGAAGQRGGSKGNSEAGKKRREGAGAVGP